MSTTTETTRTLHPDVTYWETETREQHEIDPAKAPGLFLTLALETERPMRDGKPIERKGNRGYPSFVRIDTEDDSFTVLSTTAREIARKLFAVADAADKLDDEEFTR